MTSGFNDPIIGGGGGLVYPSIHSPNFSQGPPVTGWSVDKNGNAWLYQVTTSGSVIIGGSSGWFLYDGVPAAGNSPVAYGVATGVTQDPFGNTLPVSSSIVCAAPAGGYAALNGGQFVSAGVADPYAPGFVAGSDEGAGIMLVESGSATSVDAPTTLLVNSEVNGGSVQAVSGLDGNTYVLGRKAVYTAGPQTFGSTTQAVVTGLSVPVGAGTYSFHAVLQVVGGTAVNTGYLTMDGPSTSFFSATIVWGVSAGVVRYQTTIGVNTSLGSGTALSDGGDYYCRIDGIATFTAPGNLTVNGAAGTNADTFTTQEGCLLEIFPDN